MGDDPLALDDGDHDARDGGAASEFVAVGALIGELPIGGDRELLLRWLALREHVERQVCAVVDAFDAERRYLDDGLGSTVNWLGFHARLDRTDATMLESTARRLRALPLVATGWADGTLGSGHVRSIVRSVDDRTVPMFAEHEAELVPALAELTARQCVRAMRYWRACADAVIDPPAPSPEPESSMRLSRNDSGWWMDARLDEETGALVDKALSMAEPDEPNLLAGARRALALRAICEFFLDHQEQAPGGRHRPHLNINVDVDEAGGELVDVRSGDVTLDDAQARTWACDSIVHRVLRAGSAIVDYGRATRTVPAPLWNLLVLRDRGCRFPGCERKASWCHGHHVHHWLDGGPTSADNLVLVCGHHHRLLHQRGWHAKLLPDATFEITTPTGATHHSTPPPQLTGWWRTGPSSRQ